MTDASLLARYRLHVLALRAQLVAVGITPTREYDPDVVPVRIEKAAALWIALQREIGDQQRRWKAPMGQG